MKEIEKIYWLASGGYSISEAIKKENTPVKILLFGLGAFSIYKGLTLK